MLLGFMVFVSYNDELIKVFLFLHKLYIHVFTQRQSNTFFGIWTIPTGGDPALPLRILDSFLAAKEQL